MQEHQINPHRITKPIQLLAAWLVGLVATNTIFLVAALKMSEGTWERGVLIVASILNVPGFLWALFTLQTKFRAELQDDLHYSVYLSKKTSDVIRIDKNVEQDVKIGNLEVQVSEIAERWTGSAGGKHETTVGHSEPDWKGWTVALNETREDFREIRTALRNARIPLNDIYGESPPSKWIICLNRSLPIQNKLQLLRTLLPFGFDGIQLWTPVREADENEDVYIGSYGDENYAKVTEELLELLKEEVEEIDLRRYCEKNNVRGYSRILKEIDF